MEPENTPPELHDPELEALAVVLRENRPEPDAGFAEKLDAAVADHFPPEWSADAGRGSIAGPLDRLRARLAGSRRILLPVTAGFAGLLIVAVVFGAGINGGGPGGSSVDSLSPTESSSDAGGSTASSGAEPSRIAPLSADRASKSPGAYAAGVENRRVAREAEITLATSPEDLQDVSNQIVGVVDAHNGIVLDSSVKDGPAGKAGARFSLMIPSGQLESAIGELSSIADLRSRNQRTEDVTAPVLTVKDRLQTSRARVKSLVKELAAVTTDEDRERVEAGLARERRQAARLTTRLNRLERKVNLTPVGVRVETGKDAGSGSDDSSWGIGDALDDAGRMLAISAGVALIALAIAIPIALMVLIALALNRAWVRRSRRQALEQN